MIGRAYVVRRWNKGLLVTLGSRVSQRGEKTSWVKEVKMGLRMSFTDSAVSVKELKVQR